MKKPAEVVEAYFEAWRTQDERMLRETLAPEVNFVGVLGTADGADACVKGLVHGMWKLSPQVSVLHRFVDGAEVLTWFEIHPGGGAPLQVANWSHVEEGRITRIRVTFDPRSLLEKR
ncbi:nuclear transport factor 2 family protein [Corallococcus sp. H22C18031201]|uniref:nuclear transport factor 2 family protein n=1 Tax=Citreicoccus inhibens TaxID=2849499 RepID=UPI000E73734D|nr:nuclear transport factor 2 family protein [Citreicoccus inhibens]MBU8894012.1 nuclear transport factor 2 family protein [Citreicoccus inhibens]RJS23264.1 nuclear transport factor 2 family protein [Corallococcus sp. H22C18031201]